MQTKRIHPNVLRTLRRVRDNVALTEAAYQQAVAEQRYEVRLALVRAGASPNDEIDEFTGVIREAGRANA